MNKLAIIFAGRRYLESTLDRLKNNQARHKQFEKHIFQGMKKSWRLRCHNTTNSFWTALQNQQQQQKQKQHQATATTTKNIINSNNENYNGSENKNNIIINNNRKLQQVQKQP